MPPGDTFAGLALAICIFVLHMTYPQGEQYLLLRRMSQPAQVAIGALLLALFIIIPTQQKPFIYFQF
jgi:hypothetical protein